MFGKIYLLIPLACLLALPARAGYQFFKAPVAKSTWVVESTPLICRLRHAIPLYGEVEFVRRVKAELEFSVHVKQAANRPEFARLLSRAPEWMHIAIARDFGSIPVVEGKEPFYLHNGWARRMAAELAEGMDLQLVYRDWSDGSDEITVTVLPVNFLEAWSKFQTCEKQLLNFNFADVRKTVIQYGVGKTRLDRGTQHRLDQMIRYMKIDNSVRGIRIDGYTDSKGLQRVNIVVARRRANTVRDYFIKHGISRNRIRVHAHSELDGKFSNRTPEGRRKNRRVEVTLLH
ncbi:MAG TPA: OmpA family protein [Gammaproteobacteria bacterium]|nr:OmpA family protein [Gammaproteobacteria bacterium]